MSCYLTIRCDTTSPTAKRKKMGMNHVPDNVPALMEKDFGTVVLITDPKSDYLMKKAAKKVKNSKKTD